MVKNKKRTSRRDFLRKGAAGLAGASLAGTMLKADEQVEKAGEQPKPVKRKFIHRTLGKTGLRLPVISMGVMNTDNHHLVSAALDAGIVHLDTAWYYETEHLIREAVKGRPRDSYVVATKVWEPRDRKTGLYPKDATSATFIEKFETTLRRLGMDHVDIVYLHNVSRTESLFFAPYYKALKQFKKEGRARFIGVSTHQNEPEVIRAAADCGELDVVLTAYTYNQRNRDEVKSAIGHAAKAGMGIVGMKQLAGTHRKVGARGGFNAAASLKWALQDENMHTLIPGITTFDQLETDLAVMEDLTLTPADEANLKEYRKLASLFCQQCRACLDQCPADLDIPTLMRCHMYVHGYGNLAAAREALTAGDLERPACLDCTRCQVSCTAGFDVRAKVLDVARIRDVPVDFIT